MDSQKQDNAIMHIIEDKLRPNGLTSTIVKDALVMAYKAGYRDRKREDDQPRVTGGSGWGGAQ